MEVAGVRIDSLTRDKAFSRALSAMDEEPVRVFFVNAHCVNVAQGHQGYGDALRQAEMVLNDGAGVELAGRWLGDPFPANLNGTDWIPALFASLEDHYPSASLFLLGGKPGVGEKAKAFVERQWPRLQVAGANHGYFEDELPVLEEIERVRPQVLLVGMGVPRQELFLATHWTRLRKAGVRLGIAGGAILDFMSGEMPRAPPWMQRARLEWFYRLMREPARLWRRYLIGNLKFMGLLIKELCQGKD